MLHWYLNPATIFMYLAVARPLIQDLAGDNNGSTNIQALSTYLLELSVYDTFFSDKKGSSVAYAAIMVAMDALHVPEKRLAQYQLEHSYHMTTLCAQRLRQVYNEALLQLEDEMLVVGGGISLAAVPCDIR